MENVIEHLFLEDILAEDEIDQVFSSLPQITPPSTLVSNIMSAVAQLQVDQVVSPTRSTSWDNLEVLHVSLDSQQLC